VDTMQRGASDAETCRLNGWRVGDRLVGNEGYGDTIIRITAIGEHAILAVAESHAGTPTEHWRENMWTLTCRNWRLHGQRDPLQPGDVIEANPCQVRITEVGRATWGWCSVCTNTHIIDARLFERGRGPWRLTPAPASAHA